MVQNINGVNYKLFYSGPFSNWYPSNFTVEGITYNCGEQYMMFQKALLFDDKITSAKILAESSPKNQKRLGRQVKNFNPVIWDNCKYELVKRGLIEKFNQNQNLKNELLKYEGCILVEAAPYDAIWGIGFSKETALKNFDNWGKNLLGKILTEITLL